MTLYKKRERFSHFSVKVGIFFSKARLSPNIWTLLSVIPVIISLWFLVQSYFLLAALFFIISAFMDLIDGSVARVMGKVSVFGAYLDTIIDRYVEAIIIFALLFTALPAIPLFLPLSAWLFLYFFGSLMTTYVKAAAKEKGLVSDELKGGLLERADRLIILFIGIIAAAYDPFILSAVIVILAVLSNISALQRIWIARSSTIH